MVGGTCIQGSLDDGSGFEVPLQMAGVRCNEEVTWTARFGLWKGVTDVEYKG